MPRLCKLQVVAQAGHACIVGESVQVIADHATKPRPAATGRREFWQKHFSVPDFTSMLSRRVSLCIVYRGTCRYIHTYVHTYKHTYVHSYGHTCVHTYIRTYIHTYIHMHIYHIYLHLSCFNCLYTLAGRQQSHHCHDLRTRIVGSGVHVRQNILSGRLERLVHLKAAASSTVVFLFTVHATQASS